MSPTAPAIRARWRTGALRPLVAVLLPLLATGVVQAAGTEAPKAGPAGGDRAAARVVTLGVAVPLSGPLSPRGRDAVRGAQMAIDEANAAQPRLGGQPVRWRLLAEDDAGLPQQATSVAQRFCDLGVAGVVGHLQSATSIPASVVYHRCGLPHIAISATSPELTRRAWPTTFRIVASDEAIGAALALYARQTLGVRRVAVVDDRSAYGKGIADVFIRVARQQGMTVLERAYTHERASDFSTILTTVRAARPDAIFYGGFDNQAGPMLRQMDQLGMRHVRLLGGDVVCSEHLPALAGHAATLAGVVCANGDASVDVNADGRAWRARYEAAHPGQFEQHSPYAYDATRVLIDAMQRVGSAEPARYGPELHRLTHRGVSGPIAFTANGELRQPTVTLYDYRDGQRRALNPAP